MREFPDQSKQLQEFVRKYLGDEPRERPAREANESSKFTDEQVIELLKKEKTDKGRRLLEGDISGYPSDSEADLALLAKFLFYTQDRDQVERLWMGSGLYRDKLERLDYRDRTLERAFDNVGETYHSPNGRQGHTLGAEESPKVERPDFLTYRTRIGALIEEGIPPTEFLYPDVTIKGMVHHVFAATEQGKTWLAMCLALDAMENGLSVVYLDKENGAKVFGERMETLGAPPALLDEKLFYFTDVPMSLDKVHVMAFLDAVDTIKPDFLVFDSLIGFLTSAGISENDNTETETWAATYCMPLRSRGITTMLLDHVPHDAARARGASRKADLTDVQWQLKRTEPFSRNLVGEIVLTKKKDRLSAVPDRVKFAIGGGAKGFVFRRSNGIAADSGRIIIASDGAQKTSKALKDFGSEGATSKEWEEAARELGVSRSSHFEHRERLKDRGLIIQSGPLYIWRANRTGIRTENDDRTEPGLEGFETAENPHNNAESGQSGSQTGLDSENRTEPVVRFSRTPIVRETGRAGPEDVDEGEIRALEESARSVYKAMYWPDGKPLISFPEYWRIVQEGYPNSRATYPKMAGPAFATAVCGRNTGWSLEDLHAYRRGGG